MIECIFSEDREYRYVWEHQWDDQAPCAFIGLNPSTADENAPDPTVRRCIGYAKQWGYGRLIMLNLFAYRATDPQKMLRHPRPVELEENENTGTIQAEVRFVLHNGGMVVCAWGTHGGHLGQDAKVLHLLRNYSLRALKLNKDGTPGHPLYLPKKIHPFAYPVETPK